MLTAILTNCPDTDSADAIADALLTDRLVACTNRYAPIESRFRWQGGIAAEAEVPLLVKTRPDLADRVAARIREVHPYDVPAILRIAMEAEADFLAWIGDETRAAMPD